MSKNFRIAAIVLVLLVVALGAHYWAYVMSSYDAGIHDVNFLSYIIENWIGYADPRR